MAITSITFHSATNNGTAQIMKMRVPSSAISITLKNDTVNSYDIKLLDNSFLTVFNVIELTFDVRETFVR